MSRIESLIALYADVFAARTDYIPLIVSSPAPAGPVLPVLLETDCVLAVDNWQGSDVFWGPAAPAAMQNRIAIVGDSDLSTPRLMDDFLAHPAVSGVPRRGGRGIVRTTYAASVEEGRAIYAEWRNRFGR